MTLGIVTVMFLLATPIAFAQAAEPAANPGITPDSPFYGLDVAFDRLSLWIASFSGPQAHALKGLEIAQERIAEAKAMAEQRKFEAMAKAEGEHGRMMTEIKAKIKDITDANATKEAESRLGFEKRMVKHEELIEKFRGEFEAKIELEGNITAEQQALLNKTLNNLQGQVGGVEIEIENEKAKTKIKIRQQTNKTDEEIDKEIEETGKRLGLVNMSERAAEQIEDAESTLADLRAIVQEGNVTKSAVLTLIEQAQKRLDQAKVAYNESKHGEAFGQATAAESLAKNAKRLIERAEEIEEKIKEAKETALEQINETRGRLEKMQQEGANVSQALEELEQIQKKVENRTLEERIEGVLENIIERAGRGR